MGLYEVPMSMSLLVLQLMLPNCLDLVCGKISFQHAREECESKKVI